VNREKRENREKLQRKLKRLQRLALFRVFSVFSGYKSSLPLLFYFDFHGHFRYDASLNLRGCGLV
jgi:hypothetical protein